MRAVKVFTDPRALELVADRTRRRIIHLLRARELSVSQIAAELEMTPQAIYHHVRKMLETGLIEVAREERVEHFIETFYQAAAEVFEFSYGEISDARVREAKTKASLDALTKIGLTSTFDEATVERYAEISAKIEALHKCCGPEVADAISGLEDLDFITKQESMKTAMILEMNDEQFEELQRLEAEARTLLKGKMAKG